MKKETFGKLPSGETVDLYTIENENAKLSVMTRGAAIVSFQIRGLDIIGGYDTLDGYLADVDSHHGGLIGRVANRIADASFPMDGQTYSVPKNEGENCLHGGIGFDQRIFRLSELREDRISMVYESKDGEEGFPSDLFVEITYRLDGTSLLLDYVAKPDGKTPIALTNHAYFNLNGFGKTAMDHDIRILADTYTAVDEALIPTGEHPKVAGGPFDLNERRRIGTAPDGSFIEYDHNFVLRRDVFADVMGYSLALAAEAWGEDLHMSVYTDQPGVQFYTANHFGDGPDFHGGKKSVKNGAFCLETQTEPDCIHHGIGFYDKGETYRHTTVYKIDFINT